MANDKRAPTGTLERWRANCPPQPERGADAPRCIQSPNLGAKRWPNRPAASRPGSVALMLHPLAQRLALPPNGFGFFTNTALRRLLVAPTLLHLAKDAFALHPLFEDA